MRYPWSRDLGSERVSRGEKPPRVKNQAPGPEWELGYPSSVTMDDQGAIYVLQRGEKADPVLVLNRDGKIIRSWGKGIYKIPYGTIWAW